MADDDNGDGYDDDDGADGYVENRVRQVEP